MLGQPLDPDATTTSALSCGTPCRPGCGPAPSQLVNRDTARLLGVSQRDWPEVGRVSVAKVAEYQARGVVHFHAIFRLDGPEPADPAPIGAETDLLCEAIRYAASHASIDPPDCAALDGLGPIVWGEQLDLRPIRPDPTGQCLTDGQVAGYVARLQRGRGFWHHRPAPGLPLLSRQGPDNGRRQNGNL